MSASLVGWILRHATVGIHRREVQSAVKTAPKVGNVDIECELVIEWLKQVVLGRRVQEVDTGTNIDLGAVSNEVEPEGAAGGGNAVSATIVRAV